MYEENNFFATTSPSVIPAKAGIHPTLVFKDWIPAFAGMTIHFLRTKIQPPYGGWISNQSC